MASAGVRMLEFVRMTKSLKAQEEALNRELATRFPGVGPIHLLKTKDGELAVKMTFTVLPGQKGQLDELYQFVMRQLGELRGRKPGEKKVQVKYRLPEDLHRRVQEAAQQARMSTSDVVTACLKEKFG